MTATHGTYWQSGILNAEPVELVRILYRETIRSIVAGRDCLQLGDISGRSAAITKALAILSELALAVNCAEGSEIGQNLLELYDYSRRLLLDANSRQIEAPLREVQGLLETLLEAWEKCDPHPRQPVAEVESDRSPVDCLC